MQNTYEENLNHHKSFTDLQDINPKHTFTKGGLGIFTMKSHRERYVRVIPGRIL